MAQRIMTGIGFLGAGVVFNEGLAERGLTTAASHMGNGGNRHLGRDRVLARGNSWGYRNPHCVGRLSHHRGQLTERVLCPSHAAIRARSRYKRTRSAQDDRCIMTSLLPIYLLD